MDVIRERLANQFLTGPGLKSPVEVVRALGAVQAQDYPSARWAVGMRTRGATDADVEAAVNRGEILRTHVLRPTWHFVLPEEIRWMLALTAPRIQQAMSSYNRKYGLTPAVLRRTNAVIEKEVREGGHRLRSEIRAALEKARMPKLDGQLLGHIMLHAELAGVVCSGACRGKHQTYALLDERAPSLGAFDRDEALFRLARLYFSTRGPATVHDFAWWSGLTVADSKRAVEIHGKSLVPIVDGERRYWAVERETPAPPRAGTAHLLPNYDEYFIGHRDRTAIGNRLKSIDLVTGGDSRIGHVALADGELIGGWKRVVREGRVTAELLPMVKLARSERSELESARRRFEEFVS